MRAVYHLILYGVADDLRAFRSLIATASVYPKVAVVLVTVANSSQVSRSVED